MLVFKRMSLILAAIGTLFLSHVAISGSLPSNDDISEMFATARTNLEASERVWPLFLETCHNPSNICPDEIRRAQYCIMSNVFSMTLSTNGDIRTNFHPIGNLMHAVACFDCLRYDEAAVNSAADFIGTFQLVPTNTYTAELELAIATTNGIAFNRKWRPILAYNSRIGPFRDELVTRYSPLFLAYMESVAEEERPMFITNVMIRARLSEAETRRLRAGTDDELYDALGR